LHDNVTKEHLTLFCRRYKQFDKAYEKITNKSVMAIGKRKLMRKMEEIANYIAGQIGVKGNHPHDKSQDTPGFEYCDPLGILYFTAIKNADPFDV